ncbi:hypothetical protein [Saccharicrinis aurantiacus]|uniref:hypothetical protein n=1 Tax=Saccharicrinis aurantiacus TaxID=1849719 RepID=UPI002490E51A|nr:hypothetical protein [Saccharicrinis aurantiacus]
MKFGIANYIDEEIEEKTGCINKLSNDLDSFLEKKKYSKEIDEVYFGFISVGEDGKFFFKPKKPRLSKKDKTFQFEHSFEIDEVKRYDKKELFAVIFDKLLEMPKLLPQRVSDFKAEEYEKDLNEFKDQYLQP